MSANVSMSIRINHRQQVSVANVGRQVRSQRAITSSLRRVIRYRPPMAAPDVGADAF